MIQCIHHRVLRKDLMVFPKLSLNYISTSFQIEISILSHIAKKVTGNAIFTKLPVRIYFRCRYSYPRFSS